MRRFAIAMLMMAILIGTPSLIWYAASLVIEELAMWRNRRR